MRTWLWKTLVLWPKENRGCCLKTMGNSNAEEFYCLEDCKNESLISKFDIFFFDRLIRTVLKTYCPLLALICLLFSEIIVCAYTALTHPEILKSSTVYMFPTKREERVFNTSGFIFKNTSLPLLLWIVCLINHSWYDWIW